MKNLFITGNRISFLLVTFVISILLISCQSETGDKTVVKIEAKTDSVISADNIQIYYDVYGDHEKTLVFVHGWSCDRSYWNNQVEEFAKKYRVVNIDLAGHGESGSGRDDWTIPAFGADVAAVVNKLKLANVILVGHSMGGPVNIEAALLLGDKVVALIGVDDYQNFEWTMDPEQLPGFITPFEKEFVSSTRHFVKSMFLETADSALVEKIATDMALSPPEMAISAIKNNVLYDDVTALKDMRLPIRAISSDQYPTDVEGNNEIAESFAVEIMSGVGHFLHMEKPEEFNNLLHKTIEEFWPSE